MAKASSRSGRTLADRLSQPFQKFLAIEAASTILLVLASAIALLWANSPWAEGYDHLWHTPLGVLLGEGRLELSLHHWVNDGLMVLFFFLVGMEIKHELVDGQLSSRDRAMLPVFGAIGGMVVPAAIYLAWNSGSEAASGWGVPMATDIAFAVAALAVLGKRVPTGLKVFLLALAIVDDLGAVTVIALFYTENVSVPALVGAALGLGLTYGMNLAGVRSYGWYWIVGIGVWLATLASGIHATVAGVLLGFLTPTHTLVSTDTLVSRAQHYAQEMLGLIERGRFTDERKRVASEIESLSKTARSPLEYLTDKLHPWVAFGIMPVFALANAGVGLQADALDDSLAWDVTVAVSLGLLLGKPIGITIFSWLAVRLGIAALPQGVNWGSVLGAGLLAGIGFTMALFITALAFADPALVAASKLGILGASALATLLGLLVLARTLPKEEAKPAAT